MEFFSSKPIRPGPEQLVVMSSIGAQLGRVVERLGPDLLVIDISLGGASGLELVKQAHQRRHDLLMLVLSMHDETLFAELTRRAVAWVLAQG